MTNGPTPGVVNVIKQNTGLFARPLIVILIVSAVIGAVGGAFGLTALGFSGFWLLLVKPVHNFVVAGYEVHPNLGLQIQGLAVIVLYLVFIWIACQLADWAQMRKAKRDMSKPVASSPKTFIEDAAPLC